MSWYDQIQKEKSQGQQDTGSKPTLSAAKNPVVYLFWCVKVKSLLVLSQSTPNFEHAFDKDFLNVGRWIFYDNLWPNSFKKRLPEADFLGFSIKNCHG